MESVALQAGGSLQGADDPSFQPASWTSRLFKCLDDVRPNTVHKMEISKLKNILFYLNTGPN